MMALGQRLPEDEPPQGEAAINGAQGGDGWWAD